MMAKIYLCLSLGEVPWQLLMLDVVGVLWVNVKHRVGVWVFFTTFFLCWWLPKSCLLKISWDWRKQRFWYGLILPERKKKTHVEGWAEWEERNWLYADLGPLKWVDLPSCSSTSLLGRAYLRNTVFPPLLQTQNLLLHVGCRGALALSESLWEI